MSNAPGIEEDWLCVRLAASATVAASSKAATTVFRDTLALVSTYIEAPTFCANASAWWSAVNDAPVAPILSLLEIDSLKI